ncbi:phospho-sugar mutase [Marinigracilibium pacificum]|uniref:Phospho-sugar mutase n=1 Tax=Marinigracilibium pacificum TaxID=2729599 RepID=A0A848J803_9BACT|nr:phospho-sugar mutase [Marinigracilibium pacificum]NMM49212.1 phospho-sugar mutase [Marinigracilibium pacificum]
MEQTIQNKINHWLNSEIDQDLKSQIKDLQNNGKEDELVDSFYRDLEFGTGGLRGIMGPGTNRMNKYTVGMATQGLSNYLKKSFEGEDIKVAIAHDSRNNSRKFAEITANVFSANGFKVYLFEDLRPTPELSFAIRKFGCHSGVVLTASHNPKEYNGYKAYWNDGAQVIAPHDKNIIDEVLKITDFDQVFFEGNPDLIESIGKEVDESYLDQIKSLSLNEKAIKNNEDMKIVFSPLHGTGITLVPEILKRFGFKGVHVVEEQATPNGNFPTVVYPNPEEAEALSIGLQKAKELDADLLMATDPDSDRVGIAVKNHKNEWQLLNGNQTGSLLIYYILQAYKNNVGFKGNEFIVKTIVTTELIKEIADSFDVKSYDTLTGFKHIAALIRSLEGKEKYLVGGEESYGYLIGDAVRDKDAIASCALIAEMAAWAKDNGRSLFDILLEIYQEYGHYNETLVSITKKGKSGAEEISKMMQNLRSTPPESLGGIKVKEVKDYLNLESKNLVTGKTEKIDLPKSNVLQFILEDGSKVSARPSGTEPKIKFYISVKNPLANKSEYDNSIQLLKDKAETIQKDLSI